MDQRIIWDKKELSLIPQRNEVFTGDDLPIVFILNDLTMVEILRGSLLRVVEDKTILSMLILE